MTLNSFFNLIENKNRLHTLIFKNKNPETLLNHLNDLLNFLMTNANYTHITFVNEKIQKYLS